MKQVMLTKTRRHSWRRNGTGASLAVSTPRCTRIRRWRARGLTKAQTRTLTARKEMTQMFMFGSPGSGAVTSTIRRAYPECAIASQVFTATR